MIQDSRKAPIDLSAYQFAVARISLGAYLLFYSLRVIPYGTSIYTASGLLPNLRYNFNYGFYPPFLLQLDTPAFVFFLLSLKALASATFMVGLYRRTSAMIIWLVLMWGLNRNNYTYSPELMFITWSLVATMILPPGEPWSLSGQPDPEWKFPRILKVGSLIVAGGAMSFCGFTKLNSDWLSGDALSRILLLCGSTRTWLFPHLGAIPPFVLKGLNFYTLFIETTAVFWVFIPRARPFYWLGLLAFNVGILGMMDVTEISLGMIVYCIFLFDTYWVSQE